MIAVQASLRLHVKMTHEKGHAVHQCQFCHKKFTTNHRKEIHEKRHEQQQQQQQQHPTQKESSSTAMETSPTEEPKTFTCPFCDKSFKKVANSIEVIDRKSNNKTDYWGNSFSVFN